MGQIVEYDPTMFEIVNALAKTMAEEGGFTGSWDDAKLEATLRLPNVFCSLARDDDGYFGGIIGMVAEEFFGHDLVASDLGLFILPEKRGTSAAPRLVRAFEEWAIARGARQIYLGQTTGVEIDRTRRLYEGLGYKVVGFNSRKRI